MEGCTFGLMLYSLSEDIIGVGGCGKVVQGKIASNNKAVAVKILPLQTKKEKVAYKNEAASSKKIQKMKKSSHLCNIIDIYEKDKQGYFVMKKYRYDLYTMCFERNVNFTEECFRKIFIDICTGVKNLHDIGIAHLDIKPENILFDSNDSAYLCDFGSSYITKRGKSTSNGINYLVRNLGFRGTREYCSPEIFRKEKVYDPFKCDIFSLGVLLYICLMREFPYNEDHLLKLDDCKENLSPCCVHLVKSMLSEDPQQRPSINKILRHKWLIQSKTPTQMVNSLIQLLKIE